MGRVDPSVAELAPFDVLELGGERIDSLWVRGGFPGSVLAEDDAVSLKWRRDFIRTYLERDIPQFGVRIPAERLRRFWTMLAHNHAGVLNAAQLALGIGVSGSTVSHYLDLLVDLLLVRRLQPWHSNIGKRLVKSPKGYIRDSGLVHALLGFASKEELLSHPIVGDSWEGFIIETLLGVAPAGTEASFYRTVAGAEMDLLLALPGGRLWAIEIKRSVAPKLERGFHHALAELDPDKSFVVYNGQERFPLSDRTEAIGLIELARALQAVGSKQ